MGYEESESADTTCDGGEPAPGDPSEERGRPVYGAFRGTDDEDIEPTDHLNTTRKASGTGSD